MVSAMPASRPCSLAALGIVNCLGSGADLVRDRLIAGDISRISERDGFVPDRALLVGEVTDPLPEIPEPPVWLPLSAHDVWQDTVRCMITDGTWRPRFARTVAMYATLYDDFQQNGGQIAATRLVTLRLLGADLGLSPSASTTVSRLRPRTDAAGGG